MRLIRQGERHTVEEARTLVARFLDANPAVDRRLELKFPDNHRLQCRGWYRPGVSVVLVEQMTKPGTGYSWPGHISDRTLLGVQAHELGHHVHLSRDDWRTVSADFPRDRPVTGYEKSDRAEWFAETFRLFLLNPDLLARARPLRYAYLHDRLGLRTIESRPWQTILEHAPARMVARLPGWGLRPTSQAELTV